MKCILIPALLSCTSLVAQSNQTPQTTNCELGDPNLSCYKDTAVFSGPSSKNGYGHRNLLHLDVKTYGPSVNFGNSGGWTWTKVIEAPGIVFGNTGIDQFESTSVIKNGTGDLAGLYFLVYGGGRAAQSDEGVTGMTVESGEIDGYFHGSITGPASTGITSLTLTEQPNAPHNWHYTCAGCMLLDISKGSIAGSLNGSLTAFADTYLNQLPTTNVSIHGRPGLLPLTKAWCTTLAPIPKSDRAGQGTEQTFNCKLGKIGSATPAFTPGGIVSIAGGFYPEQAPLIAVKAPLNGIQTITVSARNPNPLGSVIFQGGIAGQSLSFDDDLAFTGLRTSYYVFGSVDGINLIYGSQVAGNVQSDHRSNHIIPRRGSEAETTHSGFHLYPSAEIIANSALDSAPTLEPNTVPWASGDLVENPRFQSYGGFGIWDVCQAFTPSDEDVHAGCFNLSLRGSGVAGTYRPFNIRNFNPTSYYTAGGGPFSPVPAMSIVGSFGDILNVAAGPSQSMDGQNAVINVQSTFLHDNAPFNLFSLPDSKSWGTTKITYDPAAHLIGFPQGLNTQAISTAQNCSASTAPENCDRASAGSFILPVGASKVTINTSAVTANSQILVTPDASLGPKLGVTCNQNPTMAFALFGIIARDPGRSFTLGIVAPPNTNPNCYSFAILN